MLVRLLWKSNFLSPNVEEYSWGLRSHLSWSLTHRLSHFFITQHTFVGCLPSTMLTLGKVLRCGEEQTDMVLMKLVGPCV